MFKNPFSFDGRIRRTEYGITFIIYLIVYIVFLAVAQVGEGAGAVLALLIWIPLAWFIWAQGAKRCHDIGRSGWMQIIPFYFLWLLFQDSDRGSNEYGRNPKGIGAPGQEFNDLSSETLDGHMAK